MLHHWLAAQEGFNIKLGNVLTIDFNSQNATKLKLESKCGENFSENKFSKFSGKWEYCDKTFPIYFYVLQFGEIWHKD